MSSADSAATYSPHGEKHAVSVGRLRPSPDSIVVPSEGSPSLKTCCVCCFNTESNCPVRASQVAVVGSGGDACAVNISGKGVEVCEAIRLKEIEGRD